MSAFEQAQIDVKTLKQRPSNEDMLSLYAHFKQGSPALRAAFFHSKSL